MADLPSGTVSFLFTDIEGSTKKWQAHREKMRLSLRRHDEIMRAAITGNGGVVFKTVGDAFCAVFRTALDGVAATIEAQLALTSEPWDDDVPIKVRMALHTGEAEERDEDYYGPTLNRVARLLSIGHGGQTLVSLVTAELIRDQLPDEVRLRDMGDRRLKDLTRPESVFQIIHPDLPDEFAELASLDAHPHNLPQQPSTLIGREEQLQTIEKLFFEQGVRIVTLTGSGGIGKTRLSLQAGAEMIESFPDGAYFVNLAPVDDAGLVIPVIARTLRLRETRAHDFADVLAEHLRTRSMLLILDNLEQIMDAANRIAELVSVAPKIRIIITSREALHVRGEHVLRIPPLATPPRVQPSARVESVTQYDAVQLFIVRARAALESFTVTDQNVPAIAEICSRLDGIPLAVELAAARVSLLDPEAILERLDDRLRLLTGGARDLPPRHRTLRAAIEWSYGLLDAPLRNLLAVVGVFDDGFTIDGVEDIVARHELRDAKIGVPDVLEGVGSLLDKSIVRRTASSASDSRFVLLETIREFSVERAAEAGVLDPLKAAHAAVYASLCASIEGRVDSAESGELVRTLEDECRNVAAAVDWFILAGDTQAIQMVNALWPYWERMGYFGDGISLIERVLVSFPDANRTERATAQLGLGTLYREQGHYVEAEGAFDQAEASFAAGEDEVGAVTVNLARAVALWEQSLIDVAQQTFSSVATSAEKINQEVLQARAQMGIGAIAWSLGQLDAAEMLFTSAKEVFYQRGLSRLLAMVAANLGAIHVIRGDLKTGYAFQRQAVQLSHSLGDTVRESEQLGFLADTALQCGEVDEARTLYTQMRVLAVRLGNEQREIGALTGLAETDIAAGEIERARTVVIRAYKRAQRLRLRLEQGIALRVIGDITARNGHLEFARKILTKSIEILTECKHADELAKAHACYKQAIEAPPSGLVPKIEGKE